MVVAASRRKRGSERKRLEERVSGADAMASSYRRTVNKALSAKGPVFQELVTSFAQRS